MKLRVLFIALLFSAPIAPSISATPPKAGAICSKAGVAKNYNGKKYICIKSGKKLVWNKGVVIKAPPSSSTPTPTLSATPSLAPTPTPIILNFENIVQYYPEISRSVFGKFELFMKNNFQSNLKVTINIGPNSKPNILDPLPAYAIASKILRNFKQPQEVHAIYYSFKDKEWAKTRTQEIDGSTRWNYQFEYECLSDDNCRGASAGMTQNWQAIGRFTVKSPNAGALSLRMFTSGESEIHEFTHSVYMYQLKPNFNKWYIATPSWFSEGHATALGKLGGALSFSEYKSDQLLTYMSGRPDENLKSFRKDDILRFFEALSNGKEDPGMKAYVYSLGYSAVEALIAIGGIDSPMNLFVETSKGATFEEAFRKVYGVDWSYAAPILAEVVSLQYLPFGN